MCCFLETSKACFNAVNSNIPWNCQASKELIKFSFKNNQLIHKWHKVSSVLALSFPFIPYVCIECYHILQNQYLGYTEWRISLNFTLYPCIFYGHEIPKLQLLLISNDSYHAQQTISKMHKYDDALTPYFSFLIEHLRKLSPTFTLLNPKLQQLLSSIL